MEPEKEATDETNI